MKEKTKKEIFVIFLIGVISIGIALYFILTKPISSPNEEKKITETPPTTIKGVPLSEIQIAACNTADEVGTCETNLKKLNIVTVEECCKYLGKCC